MAEKPKQLKKTLAIDFDGTIAASGAFPEIGKPVPHALSAIRFLREQGFTLVLFTVRSGEPLEKALEWIERKTGGTMLCFTPGQKNWSTSNKVYAARYIDDAAVGCPLLPPEHEFAGNVDWLSVMHCLALDYPQVPFSDWLLPALNR